jgi:chromosome segregation ATPase
MAKTDRPIAAELPSAAEARAEVQKGLRVFKAFEHADKALALLENIEQVTRERQTAADAAQAAADAARADLDAASADVGTARDEAKQLRKEARSKAAELVRNAEAAAKASTAEAQGRVDALRNEADALVALMLEKRNELEALDAQLADAKAVIDRAERARATLAALV